MIWVDLDSTLVDLLGGLARLCGCDERAAAQAWRHFDTYYGLLEGLQRAGAPDVPASVDDLWDRVHAGGADWWAELGWTPWGRALWAEVQRAAVARGCGLGIASSPLRDPDGACAAGKARWVHRHVGDPGSARGADARSRGVPLALLRDKSILAHPGHVLIDDSAEQIQGFIGAGGCGLLWPMPWHLQGPGVDDAHRTKLKSIGRYAALAGGAWLE